MKLIVGLGNPGPRYTWTRHNLGFLAVDALAEMLRVSVDVKEGNALTGRARAGGERLLLAKPLTYMNRSGESVAALSGYYRVPPEEILVICDDLALSPGQLRLRSRGSAGGHNGLRSIIHSLGTEAFPRLRMGIGAVPEGVAGATYVLSEYPTEQRPAVLAFARRAAEAALLWAEEGIERAMVRCNGAEPVEGLG